MAPLLEKHSERLLHKDCYACLLYFGDTIATRLRTESLYMYIGQFCTAVAIQCTQL